MNKLYLFLSLLCYFPFLLTAGELSKRPKIERHYYDVAAILKALPRSVGMIIAHMAEARAKKVFHHTQVGCFSGEHYISHIDILAFHLPFIPQPNQTVIPFEGKDKRAVISKFYDELPPQKTLLISSTKKAKHC